MCVVCSRDEVGSVIEHHVFDSRRGLEVLVFMRSLLPQKIMANQQVVSLSTVLFNHSVPTFCCTDIVVLNHVYKTEICGIKPRYIQRVENPQIGKTPINIDFLRFPLFFCVLHPLCFRDPEHGVFR